MGALGGVGGEMRKGNYVNTVYLYMKFSKFFKTQCDFWGIIDKDIGNRIGVLI